MSKSKESTSLVKRSLLAVLAVSVSLSMSIPRITAYADEDPVTSGAADPVNPLEGESEETDESAGTSDAGENTEGTDGLPGDGTSQQEDSAADDLSEEPSDSEAEPSPEVSDENSTPDEDAVEFDDEDLYSNLTDEEMEELLAQLESGNMSLQSVETLAAAKVKYFSGATRVETAALQAQYAYPDGAKGVIIAGTAAWPDALAATSLAGALGYPILYTEKDSLPSGTADAIKGLKGVTHAIVLGDGATVGSGVEAALKKCGITKVERLAGADRYKTQVAIYNYGKDRKLWSSDWVVVASGSNFPDALSISSFAACKKVPIFLANELGNLSVEQKNVLTAGAKSAAKPFKKTIVLGQTNAVSAETEGFMWGVSQMASGVSKNSKRLAGADRYETCAKVASWLTENIGMTWDKVAIASGEVPADALAGGAVQGKDNSVILLTGSSISSAVKLIAANKAAIKTQVKFFGGTPSVSSEIRAYVLMQLGLLVSNDPAGISLNAMADLEVTASKGYQNYSKAQILEYLNPDNFPAGTAGFYQFAVLNQGYSGKVTAAQINSFIASVPTAQNGNLKNTGAYFIEAAKKYNINEVYLLSHAILESGWGTSALAMGKVKGYTGYYNFYGIGAYDIDPNNGGAALAKSKGWNTPQKAILGAAAWIQAQYHSNSYGQNTLYLMKWNYTQASASSAVWKQYATGRTWSNSIAVLMDEFYRKQGIPMDKTGLTFKVPKYS